MLQPPPAAGAFQPSSPGLLVTMPYRAVFAGETITVTLQAVQPGMQVGAAFCRASHAAAADTQQTSAVHPCQLPVPADPHSGCPCPQLQGLTGCVIPVRYDRRVLEFRGVTTAALWLPAVVSMRPVGGTEEIQEVALADRAAGTASSS